MRFHFATPLLAGCVAQAVADAPAAIVNAATVSSPKTQDLLSAPTNGNGKRTQHRLLQKFKKRKERAFNAQLQNQGNGEAHAADVGILSTKSDTPRFLETSYDYFCPRQTCPAELCDCADSGGSLEDCTTELQNVCRAGRLGDCVFKDYVKVYEEVYCPFVSCVGEGFRENQCDCAFYELYCSRLGSGECNTALQVSSDDPDKKPFFGCDETELKNVCDQAHTCKAAGDLQGLPDLGTWQGSVTTGIRNSGESVGGGMIMAGVTLLSTFWLMVNV